MKTPWVATLNASGRKWLEKLTKNGVFLITALVVQYCSESEDMVIVEEPEVPALRAIIVYTDLDPDFMAETINDTYKIDLDHDGSADFTLCFHFYSYTEEEVDYSIEYLEITSGSHYSDNGVISVTPWFAHPLPLEKGMEIYNLRDYKNGESYSNSGIFMIGDCAGYYICNEDWKEKGERYLGFRFYSNGEKHYGWARMEVSSPAHWTIKDYAYNATSDMPILAGQME